MAGKSLFFKSDSPKEEPREDGFLNLSQDFFSPQEDPSSKPLFEEESAKLLLNDGIPLVSSKDLSGPSVPQGPQKGPSIALRWDKNKKLIKIFLISGGVTALLLTLRAGSYLFTDSSSFGLKPTATANEAVAPPSDLSGSSRPISLPVVSPTLIPVPDEIKSSEPLSPVKKTKSPPPPKPKEKSSVAANQKVNKNTERVYKLYINRKFIMDETRAISLKLSLLGIKNRIVKRKDGGYTIFAGTYKELSKAGEARNKILNAGYQVSIYSVTVN